MLVCLCACGAYTVCDTFNTGGGGGGLFVPKGWSLVWSLL